MLLCTDWTPEMLVLDKTLFWTAASSALLLSLLGLLSHLLLKTLSSFYHYYVNCRRLRCFPEPPRHNWLLGHLGMFEPSEEDLVRVAQLVSTFSQAMVTWMGPFLPIVSLFHPDYIKPIATASADVAPKDKLFYGFLKPWLESPTALMPSGQKLHQTGPLGHLLRDSYRKESARFIITPVHQLWPRASDSHRYFITTFG